MKFSLKKIYSAIKSYKCSSKFGRGVVGTVLCVVLLGTNAAGTLAVEVPMTKSVVSAKEAVVPTEASMRPGNAENLGAHITAWTWVDEEEILTECGGEWYLSLPGADMEDLTEDLLKEMLPKEVRATLSNGEEITLPLTWDFSSLFDKLAEAGGDNDGAAGEKIYRFDAAVEGDGDYPLADNVYDPYVFCTFGGIEEYAATYPGSRTILENEEALRKALADPKHQVSGVTPAGTKVNLFDYVASKDGAKEKDLTDKVSVSGNPYSVATSVQWNKGINENRLLLFGDSMVGAGYWNLGAGAGRKWAQDNTNMKGIVKSVLNADGYPEVDTNAARSKLPLNGKNYAENGLPFCLGWAEDAANKQIPVTDAPALSTTVLNNNTQNHSGNTSLGYLFDPSQELGNDIKRSYQNVTGLFQVDKDGYYYYNARENFAEFNETENTTSKDGVQSDGSFTLYDGPAIWRSDGGWDGSGFNGGKSLGNFFPFNKGEQVFDSIDNNNKLSSSENLDSAKWSSTDPKAFKNAATGKNVFINHHMGMTMQVDFTQPENGQLNMGSSGKKDMVFQFSGDDDVWIFIDGVLVLDLGGIHSELYGTINFSTGEVVTGQSWRYGGLPDNPGENNSDTKTTLYNLFVEALGQEQADAIQWVTNDSGKKIFPTGTDHSLKMFYLERGNYDSSLQMCFNLQPPLYHSIKKVDQNGEPLEGVVFELYAAQQKDGVTGESTDVADYEIKSDAPIGTLTTGKDGKTSFTRADGSPFSFNDQYHSDGTLYYILKEIRTAGGYRALPKDIVLRFNRDTSMLVVANRYQTGAYASFFSNIRETGKLTYGQFDEQSGAIASSQTELGLGSKKGGLIVAVPMLRQSGISHDEMANDGKWLALYGSNTEGYGAVAPAARTAEAWRKAVLKAALYQASDERWPEWRLTYNEDTGKLEGLLEDLPGRADRYVLNNENGDMKMVYGIIEPGALSKLGISGGTSAELYDALEAYVSGAVEAGAKVGKSSEAVIDEIVGHLAITGDNFSDRDFSFLNTDQFQREFRSIIYIPNERRELHVQKVDEDGQGVNGVEFTLTGPDNSVITGITDTVDGRDGVLIFRPDAPENKPGYARAKWAEVGSGYTLTETGAPEGYELNTTKIPVVVGIYSIYADAGTKDDGVTVMAGVGKLMQTMTKYAADDMVNITLRDITAIAQTQKTNSFSLDGWADDKLEGTQILRSMNLHYGINAVVDYGLHDEDGGKNIYPFFTTDEGFLRARVMQNTAALQSELYEGDVNTANWDDLSTRDLTSLFSLLNTVVVTNKKTTTEETGKLRVSKTVSGNGLSDADFTTNFTFTVELKKEDGTTLDGEYYYYGEQRAGYIRDGDTLSLRHDEALTILGLPIGTKWKVSEQEETEWSIIPETGIISGVIKQGETVNAAFTNYKEQNMTEFSFTKVKAEDTAVGLTGAEFKLYQLVCTDVSHDHNALVDAKDPGNCWKIMATKTSDPKVTFTGLLPGEYRLVETRAPDGRVLPVGQWKVEIAPDQQITIKALGDTLPPAFALDKDKQRLLPNMQPADIPTSGGRGTIWFILLGTLLMGGALLMGVTVWKHNGRKRERRVL